MRGRTLEFALATLIINVTTVIAAILIATRIGEYIEELFETITAALTTINTFL